MPKLDFDPRHDTRYRSRFTIQVTEKDIKNAHINDSYKCIVSQAIARAIPDASQIETDIQSIRFTRQNERLIFLTPYTVQGYVVAFDAGEPIKPFSFRLNKPLRAQRRTLTENGRKKQRVRIARARKKDPTYGQRKRPVKPEVTAEEREQARAAVTLGFNEAAAAAEQLPGPYTTVDDGTLPLVRTVHKNRSRTYGHRQLRINQERPKVEDFSAD